MPRIPSTTSAESHESNRLSDETSSTQYSPDVFGEIADELADLMVEALRASDGRTHDTGEILPNKKGRLRNPRPARHAAARK